MSKLINYLHYSKRDIKESDLRAHLHNSVDAGMHSAKLPHREALSARCVGGGGVRTLDFSPPCTELGKNVPCSPLQGRCPCGSLAKRPGLR